MDAVDDVELLVERVAALDLGKAVLEGAGAAPTAARQANAGVARLRHDHRTVVGDGGLLTALAGAAGGDGIDQHLVAVDDRNPVAGVHLWARPPVGVSAACSSGRAV